MSEIAFEYKKMLDIAFKEKIKELAAEFKMDLKIFKDTLHEKILCELLIKNKDFFLIYFVHLKEAKFRLYPMYYLGEINGRNLFFDLDEEIVCEEISKNRVIDCEINESDIWEIIKILEEKVENGIKSDEISVPEGYVALSHKHIFISGSGREEEGSFIFAYRAETLDEALKFIPLLMGVYQGVKYWGFQIYFQGKWHELKVNHNEPFSRFQQSSAIFTLK